MTDIQKRIASNLTDDGAVQYGAFPLLSEMLTSGAASRDDFHAVGGGLLERIQAWGRMHRTPEPIPIQEYAADIVAAFEELKRLRKQNKTLRAIAILAVAERGGRIEGTPLCDVEEADDANRVTLVYGHHDASVHAVSRGNVLSGTMGLSRLLSIIEELKS